jgi:ankyrin repeat protein/DNA polymerase III delta prime subunit
MSINFEKFITACKNDDLQIVLNFHCQHDDAIFTFKEKGNNPYHICAWYGSFKVLEFLLAISPKDINLLNGKLRAPIHLAIEYGWTKCVKLLIENCAVIRTGRYIFATLEDFEPYIKNEFMRGLIRNNMTMKLETLSGASGPVSSLPKSELDLQPQFSFPSFSFDNFTSSVQRQVAVDFSQVKKETLKDRINNSTLPEDYKKMALDKELSISNNLSSSASKDKEWVESLLRIPFNKYSNLVVSKKSNTVKEIRDFFVNAVKDMDDVSYGMDTVKEEILDCVSQMISTNSECMPRVLCLQGSAGTGKTSFIRGGLAKILNRPFKQINMGGLTDSSFLLGHEQTYVGSRAGMIVNSLIETKVMNPIIFMDEVDKISTSEKGIDIQSVLIHLTDPVQNSDFQDKYFPGVNIDLSKVLFIFSCNDDTKLSPILKDRLNIIRVKNPSVNDKVIIGKKYLLKELCPNIGIDLSKIIMEEETVKYIVTNYCKDDVGLRGLKKCIESVLMKINSALYNPLTKYKTLKNISLEEPFEITIKVVEDVLKKTEDKYSELMNSMFL